MARRFAAQAMGNVLERAYFLSREGDRKSTRLNSSHVEISYAVFCLKKKNKQSIITKNSSSFSFRSIYLTTDLSSTQAPFLSYSHPCPTFITCPSLTLVPFFHTITIY